MSININPNRRDDLSKFLVHLTRDSDNDSITNLINILKSKTIEARNPHCLFNHSFSKLNFSKLLKKQFNTVCLTEVPLHQIKVLVGDIPGRKIKLRPYGLVFWKDSLIEEGASPAIYINAKGTRLKKFLLHEFQYQFKEIRRYKELKEDEKDYYKEIIQYYSLVNIISNNYDFMWEREWRFPGDLKFKYSDIVAIISEDKDLFLDECEKNLTTYKIRQINKLPIISPEWNYEEVIEEMSYAIWRS